MKLIISLLPFAAAILAPVNVSALVGKALTPGLRRNLFSGVPNSNEICFSGPKNYSPMEVTLLHSLASNVADESFTGVSPPGEGAPHYTLGCGFLDFKCYACDLCQDIYGALVDTGSEETCDAACIGIAEAAGGGPEDPIADMVAAACIPLCEAIFSSVGGRSAKSVCTAAHLC